MGYPTFSTSFLQFLREKHGESAVARLLINAMEKDLPMHRKMVSTQEINYITMRSSGMLSYLPAGKEHVVNQDATWNKAGRQEGKPAKVIRKLFTERALRFIKAQEFEMFGNKYKARFMDNGFQWNRQSRTQIKSVYDMRRADGEASLNGSCMNGDSSYLDIYASCKALTILTLTNKNDHLCGRALVWDLTVNEEKITFMDRIYVVEDYMYDLFLEYAREQGWWRKVKYQSQENKALWVSPDGETKTMYATISTPTDFDRYPYIDTFCFGYDHELFNDPNTDCTYTYQETNGSREGGDDYEEEEERAYDEINDEYIHQDDAVYLCRHGEQRFRDRTTNVNNAVMVRVHGRDTEYFHEDDGNITSIGGRWYWTGHDEVVMLADGTHEILDNTVMCETDNEYYHCDDSDLLRANDGNYYHKENDDNVVYAQGNGKQGIAGEFKYLPEYEGEIVRATDGNHYWSHDDRITQVADDEDSAWFVIEHDSPRMILQVDGLWHHRSDVADVKVYDCDDQGNQIIRIEPMLQKDPRVVFVETTIRKNKIEAGWYRKIDLIKYRGRYYRKDDQRLLIRVISKFSTRKAQTV